MGVEGRSCRQLRTGWCEAPARRNLTWVLPASPAGRSLCSIRFEASRGEAGSGSRMAFLSLRLTKRAMRDSLLKKGRLPDLKKRADPRPRRSGSTPAEELVMRTIRLLTTVACLAPWALPASANDEVQKLIQDPNQWAIQTGDYANTRYSKLDQINAGNVGKMQAAWTFSTGVLRGHEGAPLVVGDVMYVHTPFPNIVYALDLNNDGKIIWKYEPKQDPTVFPKVTCTTVHRGVAAALLTGTQPGHQFG